MPALLIKHLLKAAKETQLINFDRLEKFKESVHPSEDI